MKAQESTSEKQDISTLLECPLRRPFLKITLGASILLITLDVLKNFLRSNPNAWALSIRLAISSIQYGGLLYLLVATFIHLAKPKIKPDQKPMLFWQRTYVASLWSLAIAAPIAFGPVTLSVLFISGQYILKTCLMAWAIFSFPSLISQTSTTLSFPTIAVATFFSKRKFNIPYARCVLSLSIVVLCLYLANRGARSESIWVFITSWLLATYWTLMVSIFLGLWYVQTNNKN